MEFKPHDYQRYAIDFLKQREKAMLFLDLGLGKTAISLMAIKELMDETPGFGKTLVIAPLRVARSTWPAETAKWDQFRDLRVAAVLGSCKEREAALMQDADMYLINRENVKWLAEYFQRHRIHWPFQNVIIDELSSFKNYRSQRFRALRLVRSFIKRIWGLTATPAPNGLLDLWGQVTIIDQGERFGTFIGKFRERYFRPSQMNPYTGVVYSYELLPGAKEKIYEKISDICISMKSIDHLDMPRKIEISHEVELDPQERRIYEQMRKDLVTTIQDEEITAANAAVLSGKLLQMANGAIYSDDGAVMEIHEQKLEMLLDLIEQANGNPVLVAYWFKHDRKRIEEYLTYYGIPVREIWTVDDINDWNAGRIPVALISPASAGHGLNLQNGGHILIWFSLIWNLELYEQTIGRIYRQGQTQPVSIHHIVCKDSVDENVQIALEKKDMDQGNLIAAVKANLGRSNG